MELKIIPPISVVTTPKTKNKKKPINLYYYYYFIIQNVSIFYKRAFDYDSSLYG